MTKQTKIDYAQHDVSISQEHIFELLRAMANPDGSALVNLLLKERYNWFSVVPIHAQPYVPGMEVSSGSYYADGVNIYTDVGGEKKLVPILKEKFPDTHVDFMTMRPMSEVDEDSEEDFPDEATAFIVMTWDVPSELEQKFMESVK